MTGYGLEGAIPDAVCNRIVENEMIPHFKDGDIYAGFEQAVNTLIPLATGEYSSDAYMTSPMKATVTVSERNWAWQTAEEESRMDMESSRRRIG